jgi:hypothetical protein
VPNVRVSVLTGLEELGANGFPGLVQVRLACAMGVQAWLMHKQVGQGSMTPPAMVEIHYEPEGAQRPSLCPPVCLIRGAQASWPHQSWLWSARECTALLVSSVSPL